MKLTERAKLDLIDYYKDKGNRFFKLPSSNTEREIITSFETIVKTASEIDNQQILHQAYLDTVKKLRSSGHSETKLFFILEVTLREVNNGNVSIENSRTKKHKNKKSPTASKTQQIPTEDNSELMLDEAVTSSSSETTSENSEEITVETPCDIEKAKKDLEQKRTDNEIPPSLIYQYQGDHTIKAEFKETNYFPLLIGLLNVSKIPLVIIVDLLTPRSPDFYKTSKTARILLTTILIPLGLGITVTLLPFALIALSSIVLRKDFRENQFLSFQEKASHAFGYTCDMEMRGETFSDNLIGISSGCHCEKTYLMKEDIDQVDLSLRDKTDLTLRGTSLDYLGKTNIIYQFPSININAIVKAISKNSSLTKLTISFPFEFTKHLAKTIMKHKSIRQLELTHGVIMRQAAFRQLLQIIKNNKILLSLKLINVYFKKATGQELYQLLQALQDNRTIATFHLDINFDHMPDYANKRWPIYKFGDNERQLLEKNSTLTKIKIELPPDPNKDPNKGENPYQARDFAKNVANDVITRNNKSEDFIDALHTGSIEKMQQLSDNGFNPMGIGIVDDNENTALHLAVMTGNIEVIQYLMNTFPVNHRVVNKKGLAVDQIAKALGKDDGSGDALADFLKNPNNYCYEEKSNKRFTR